MTEPRRTPGGKGDWKSAREARKGGGVVKVFAATVVLGVAAGLAYVNLDKIKALVAKPEAPVETVPIAKPNAPAERDPAPIAKPATPIAKPADTEKTRPIVDGAPIAKVSPNDEAVRKLIESGKAALNKMDFAGAEKILRDAASRKAGSVVGAEARLWHAKAAAFETATRHIPVSEYATAETTYIIATLSGERMGIVKSETPEQIVFQDVLPGNPASMGRQIMPISAGDILSKTPVPLSKRRVDFQNLVRGLESGLAFHRSTDFYDLVYLSKRLGLAAETVGYLERAYSGGEGHAGDPDLGDSFRKEVIRRAIDYCSLALASGQLKYRVESRLNDLVNKELPNYPVAKEEADAFRMNVLSKVRDDFKPTLRVENKPVAVAAKSKEKEKPPARNAKQLANEDENIDFVVESGGVRGGPLVDKANSLYEEGLKKYKSFKQGTNGNNNKILDEARDLLMKAVDLYGEALQKDPANKAVADRQVEANMIVYACRKYHTL